MTKTITNNSGIPLYLAVWLAHDEYDHISQPDYISVTGLMKPLRHILLPARIHPSQRIPMDVEDLIASAYGHAIHDSTEKAWVKGYRRNLAKLGYPQSVIDRVLINPTDAELDARPDAIPIYLEQRMYRRFGNYIIGGKFDAITDGIVNDTKSTSAYSWVSGGKTSDFQLQMSIYRWLDANGNTDIELGPETRFRPRITEDYGRINFVFTDWKKIDAITNKAYPARRVMDKEIQLLSTDEVETWIREKLRLIEKFRNTPEHELPECTPEELWQSEPVWKYYKNPAKTDGRSTKNFDTAAEAYQHLSEQGGVGVVIEVPGKPKRCDYCPAFDACTQKDRYK
jgi:hypothetical protein